MTRPWHRRTSAVCIAVVLAAASGIAKADEPIDTLGPVVVGSRVRLLAPSVVADRIEGLVLDIDDDALLVGSDHAPPVRVPRDAVARLEVSTGRRGHALQGMVIGGAASGLLFGVIDQQEYCAEYYDPLDKCPSRAEMVGIGVFGGAVWGLLIGHLMKGDRWSAVPTDRLHVRLAPARSRGTWGVALSAAW
jgi:hypothetical protein